MKKNFSAALAAVLLLALLSGCQRLETSLPSPDGQENVHPDGELVEFVTSIGSAEDVMTRAVTGDDGKGTFSENDRITLYVKPEGSEKYTKRIVLQWKGGDWKKLDGSRLRWGDIGEEAASFSAFYCSYMEDFFAPDHRGLGFKVEMDQNSGNGYDKSDVLMAECSARRNEALNLHFTHMMSLVEFVFTSSNGSYTSPELSRFTLHVKAVMDWTLNTSTGKIEEVNGNETLIRFRSLGNGRYRVLLPPQVVRTLWKKSSWVEIASGNRKISYKAPAVLSNGTEFDRLHSGKKVTFHIDLVKGDKPPVNEWAGKTAWVYGLKEMPDVSTWGYYFISTTDPNYRMLGLDWNRKYGWYDCTKSYPVKGSTPAGKLSDNNLCWAATCSNLIYWWLDRNAENIARYGKYDGPRIYNDAFDCEVFDFFKKSFTDEGCFIESGLDWFFRGVYVRKGDDSATLKEAGRKHKGFFTDVFGSDPSRMICRVATGATMSEDLKNAFLNEEAVGVSLEVAGGTGGHAITLWGAKFDEKGDPCVLYLTENNDKEEATQGLMDPRLTSAGIYEKNVIRKENGEYYMESGAKGKYTIRIAYLVYLNTRQDDWNAYFSRVGK